MSHTVHRHSTSLHTRRQRNSDLDSRKRGRPGKALILRAGGTAPALVAHLRDRARGLEIPTSGKKKTTNILLQSSVARDRPCISLLVAALV